MIPSRTAPPPTSQNGPHSQACFTQAPTPLHCVPEQSTLLLTSPQEQFERKTSWLKPKASAVSDFGDNQIAFGTQGQKRFLFLFSHPWVRPTTHFPRVSDNCFQEKKKDFPFAEARLLRNDFFFFDVRLDNHFGSGFACKC